VETLQATLEVAREEITDLEFQLDESEAGRPSSIDMTLSYMETHYLLSSLVILKKMSTTRQTLSSKAIKRLITQRVADVLTAYKTNRNSRAGANDGAGASDSVGGVDHTARPLPLPPTNQRILVTFFECEVKGQYKSECSKLKNPNKRRAHAKAFVLGGGEALQDPNVVTGMFLLNNRYAYVLFDSGADRSFVSVVFSPLIDITPTALDTKYTIELADGKLIEADNIIRGCALNLLNHPLNINLMPVDLKFFDVILGMEWLSKYHA
nr:reverse transcriptase domain-containing protein [Tanacetum cinerariifolium]